MKKNRLTVALLGEYFGWGGGIDFLRHIANGLLSKKHTYDLKVYLLLPVTNKVETPRDIFRMVNRSLKGTIEHKSIWLALPEPNFNNAILDFFSHAQDGEVEIHYYDNSDRGLLRCLKRIQADVALPVYGGLGRDFPIPWLGYIYDFQHKYLSYNFDSSECFDREIAFATTLRDSKALIVNAKSVKDDICRFYPWVDASKIFNLPFAPYSHMEWFEPYEERISIKYNLPSMYFLISNQFWIHKDHKTAFKALKQVSESYEVSLVCTGAMSDHRHPNYLQELEYFIDDNGLNKMIRFLGYIPKRDQIEIMKNSIAIIQPTLCEGGPGGGSVYDAVSLGIPVVISDIPVNREVIAENIHFFVAGNHEDLAIKMLEILTKKITRPSHEQLISMGKNNISKLGDCLVDAISHVCHN